jgi:hypothetical protein
VVCSGEGGAGGQPKRQSAQAFDRGFHACVFRFFLKEYSSSSSSSCLRVLSVTSEFGLFLESALEHIACLLACLLACAPKLRCLVLSRLAINISISLHLTAHFNGWAAARQLFYDRILPNKQIFTINSQPHPSDFPLPGEADTHHPIASISSKYMRSKRT